MAISFRHLHTRFRDTVTRELKGNFRKYKSRSFCRGSYKLIPLEPFQFLALARHDPQSDEYRECASTAMGVKADAFPE
jgi:hypothetical protein